MNPSNSFVFDTNILVSALIIKGSIPFKALEKATYRGTVVFSEETFLELESVLFRKKFDRYFSQEERLTIIERFHSHSKFIPVVSNMKTCRDPEDDKFLNIAIDANSSFIISGDDDLLVLNPFNKIAILPPAEFLNLDF